MEKKRITAKENIYELSAAKNRFVKEKNEFARRKNFISTIKTATILLN